MFIFRGYLGEGGKIDGGGGGGKVYLVDRDIVRFFIKRMKLIFA